MQKLDRQFIKKVRRKDRIATRIITVGGLLVIASVIAILVLIVRVTLPLFLPAQATKLTSISLPGKVSDTLAVGVDDYQEVAYTLDRSGEFTFFALKTGALLQKFPAAGKTGLEVKAVELHKNNIYTLLWADNSVTATSIDFHLIFAGDGTRTVEPIIDTVADFPAAAYAATPLSAAVRRPDSNRLTLVVLLEDGSFQLSHEETSTDIFEKRNKGNRRLPPCRRDSRQGDRLYRGRKGRNTVRRNQDRQPAALGPEQPESARSAPTT